ncbi:MAG: TauD/TfdA family dioxygenase, partial [Methylococcales bacterium]
MYLNSPSKIAITKLDPSIIQVEAWEPGIGLIDLEVKEIKSLFKTNAAVLFTGFQPDMRSFEQFTDQFCSDWMLYQGGAHDRQILNEKTDYTVYSVNIYMGQEKQYMWELPMHSDMSYQGYHPAILFFYCLKPARNGGETSLCDGLRVYQT